MSEDEAQVGSLTIGLSHDCRAAEVRITAGVRAPQRAILNAGQVELLITRLNFAEGRSNGLSLALTTHQRRPGVKVCSSRGMNTASIPNVSARGCRGRRTFKRSSTKPSSCFRSHERATPQGAAEEGD